MLRNGLSTISSRNLHDLLEKQYKSNVDVRKNYDLDLNNRIDSVEQLTMIDDLAGQNPFPNAWNNTADRAFKAQYGIPRDSKVHE